jgi:copper chaperone NosL
MKRRRYAVLVAALFAACAGGPAPPVALEAGAESCAWCRMSVSDPRLASQLVAPAEEPRFFDDIGCLRDFVRSTRARPEGMIAYVADHRTKAWVPAAAAVYSRCPGVATPMGSHLVAHADAASRDRDPAARGAQAVPGDDLFGPSGPPGAKPGAGPPAQERTRK